MNKKLIYRTPLKNIGLLPLLSLPPEKSFGKISYISYTHTPEFQYLLMISGVGQGVGLCFRV